MKKYILPCLLVLLSITYSLSFLKGKSKIKTFNTCFLNPENLEKVSELSISDSKTSLIFSKNGNYFEGSLISSQSEEPVFFPCDSEIVEKQLKTLSNVITMSKISDKSNNLEDYNLDDEHKIHVFYKTSSGTESSFFIGGTDFSKKAYYILLQNKKGIYKAQTDLEYLTHLETRMWYDPYIIPRNLLYSDYKDIQKISFKSDKETKIIIPEKTDFSKLFELRHGSIGKIESEDSKQFELQIEFGKDENLKMTFYRTSSDYLILYEYNEKTYAFHISEWTYKKFMDEAGL